MIIMEITDCRPNMTHRVQRPAHAELCGVGRGTATRVTLVPLNAMSIPRFALTSTSGFGWFVSWISSVVRRSYFLCPAARWWGTNPFSKIVQNPVQNQAAGGRMLSAEENQEPKKDCKTGGVPLSAILCNPLQNSQVPPLGLERSTCSSGTSNKPVATVATGSDYQCNGSKRTRATIARFTQGDPARYE
jgi:hypothetical protein